MASKITIKNMRTRGVTGSLKAFFAVDFGPFSVEDLRLIDGPSGLFVGVPSKKYTKDGEDRWFEIVRFNRDDQGNLTPSATRLRNEILEMAVAEYERRSGTTTATAVVDADEDDDLPF
jgi:DNA-binding cell septation regulator SpoVG